MRMLLIFILLQASKAMTQRWDLMESIVEAIHDCVSGHLDWT